MPTIAYSQTWDVDTGSPDGFDQMTRSTTTKHAGAGAVRLNGIGATAYWLKNIGSTQNLLVMQAYVYFASLPIANNIEILGTWVSGYGDVGIGYDLASNKFHCEANGASHTPGGAALATSTWYKVDLKINATSSTIAVDGAIDGTNLIQATDSGGPLSLIDYRIGNTTVNSTMDMFVDDFQVSFQTGDYPIGAGVTSGGATSMLLLGVG